MTTLAAAGTTSFERADVRRVSLIVLLVAAFVSPNIDMPGALPAVRIEQLVLLLLLPFLVLLALREPHYRRLTGMDCIFALFALAITASIVFAPLIVTEVSWSVRDPFEVARVFEYWLLYRLALTVVPEERTSRQVLLTIFAIAIGVGFFSLLQYIDGFGGHFINPRLTRLWAFGHNYVGVQRASRVVGTVGNANYYSMLSAVPLLLSLGVILLRKPLAGRAQLVVVAAVAVATLSMVMSQSRTAAVSLLIAMVVGLAFVIVSRRPAAPFKAIGLWLVCLVVAITFVELNPPYVGTFHARFDPFRVADDSSATIRLARLKTLFTGFFADEASFCAGEKLQTLPVARGHEPNGDAGAPPASRDQQARDVTRKADVVTITGGVIDYFCAEDEWPVGDSLEALLAPRFIDSVPVDPLTGEAYLSYLSAAGFTIGARLEDANDLEGPIYTVGTIPNIVLNSSFESGGERPSGWTEETDAMVSVVPDGLFGVRAARVQVGPGGDVRHLVVFDFTTGTDYTAGIWARTDSGADQQVRLYLVGQVIDGSELDPFARGIFTLPRDGRWVNLQLPFRTPDDATRRVIHIQFSLRAPTNDGSADFIVDAATVAQGTFSPNFVRVSDVDPARLRPTDLPQFSDSPILGTGPRNNAQAGSFDNEYALMLDRFGVAGFIPYIALYIGALVIAWRAWRRDEGLISVFALGLGTFTLGLLVFNLGAGSFFHFQIMAVYWLLLGYLAASRYPAEAGIPEPIGEPAPAIAAGAQPDSRQSRGHRPFSRGAGTRLGEQTDAPVSSGSGENDRVRTVCL